MKELFKCEYTGELFEDYNECLKSEHKSGGTKEKFYKKVEEFVHRLRELEVEVFEDTLKYDDLLHEELTGNLSQYRYIIFEFNYNGKISKYHKRSDSVGDGRWEWGSNDVDDWIKDFEHEYVLSNRKSYKGIYDWYCEDYNVYLELDGYSLERLLQPFEGKKIKIELIED